VVQLVDSLDLATNIELLNSLVQVYDGRVLGVTTEDKLSLFGPKFRDKPTSASPTKAQASPTICCKIAKFATSNTNSGNRKSNNGVRSVASDNRRERDAVSKSQVER
jgi:hypothetical protein